MAPKMIRKDVQSEKSDVYGYGITLNELITGVVPFTDRMTAAQAHKVLEMNYSEQQLSSAVTSQGLRLVIAGSKSGIPLQLSTLIEQCWHCDPAKRPSFEHVAESLHEITAKLLSGQKLADRKPDVSISDKNGLEAVLNYTREERTDVNWATRTVEGLRSTVMEPSSPGWLNQASEDSSYLPGAVNGFICNRRSKTNNGGYVLLEISWEELRMFTLLASLLDNHRGPEAAEFTAIAIPPLLFSMASTSEYTIYSN